MLRGTALRSLSLAPTWAPASHRRLAVGRGAGASPRHERGAHFLGSLAGGAALSSWLAPKARRAMTSAAASHRWTPLQAAGSPGNLAGHRTGRRSRASASTTSAASWASGKMSQLELMLRDECILVDLDDNVVGHDNKYESHIFCELRPRAKLHRAFSVFLFDSAGRLLLQQRAASKITFPSVWTNTCCSHPLFGFDPTEVDSPADVASGEVPGAKRAAVRKLDHELGIRPEQLSGIDFKFLTRLHYWAADVVSHGSEAPFGEHEIDYILFGQGDIGELRPNPEEVQDYRYVTQAELQALMEPSTNLLWSPWFRIIAERFLSRWWADLPATLQTNEFVDLATIHRFDCSGEHLGGAGGAGAWLDKVTPPDTAELVGGDRWLQAVAVGGGSAPRDAEPMKGRLRQGEDGTWSLAG